MDNFSKIEKLLGDGYTCKQKEWRILANPSGARSLILTFFKKDDTESVFINENDVGKISQLFLKYKQSTMILL